MKEMHKMDKKDITLIAVAVVICVIICALSPYIASGDPDGLEKSAEDSGLPEDFSIEEIKGIPDAIFPDYAFANAPDNQVLQIVALVIGAIVTLGVGYIVAEVVRNRN
jgi:cobalt/nickel transport protein